MSASLLQMWQGLDLESFKDLGNLDEDLLQLRNKGLQNLKIFFQQYITGKLILEGRRGGGEIKSPSAQPFPLPPYKRVLDVFF